jgi:hypothetical protein
MDANQEPFVWENSNGYEKVLFAATEALKTLGATDKNKAQKYSAVYAKARELFPQLTMPPTAVAQNSFYAYLSQTVQDENSPINCEGPWKGYYLIPADVAALPPPAVTPEEVASEQRERREKEGLLYPTVLKWLQAQGYRCAETSSGRKLGRWGNPDITGLLVTETVGTVEVEVATIEVKPSFEDWEYWIFEAVSHRRFSNRAYFAFAHPEELALKLPSAMRYYSELYRIGILALMLSNDAFGKLKDGKVYNPIDPNEVFVQELYSAPFVPVQAQFRKKFLEEGLRLREFKHVCTWGKPIEETL